MAREYVEKRNGSYYLIGSRVSLESIIYQFLDGASPESIMKNFPSLALEHIYGAITFYLANRSEMDTYLTETEKLWEEARKNQDPLSADLQRRLAQARQETLTK
ncbi:MAG: DUF433 domain-containing protein [Terriglobia bacterium]